ncbi:MAG: hypothetical protein DRO12_03375 [Thermoprotei archaeon]|nr:MAG: hypothetical protein DRO12_03375 [Thermoprotei archaeon]
MPGLVTPVRVLSLKRVSPTYWWLELELIEGEPPLAEPGQFLLIWLPRLKEVPMSVAYLNKYNLCIFFKIVGKGTERLANLRQGDYLGIKFPLGRGFSNMVRGIRPLLVGGGTGLAPLIYASLYLSKRGLQPVIAWGTRDSEDAEAVEKFLEKLVPGTKLFVASEDCKYGFCGTVVDLVRTLIKEHSFSDFVLAGPKAMMQELGSFLLSTGHDPITLLETKVRCGVGMCGACYIKNTPYLLCKDGPAFRFSQVRSYFENS